LPWDKLQIVRAAAPLIAIAAAATWFQPDVSGSDLWWHLAAGREIWAHGGPVRVDLFSYTAPGQPWLNPYFLWEAAYWWLYQLEPQSIAWLQLGVLGVTFSVLYAVARRASSSSLGAGIAICVAAAVSHWFLDIRPNGFSLLFLAIVLWVRNRDWAPWLWAPLIALWANIHGGFAFGIGVIGSCVLVRTLERSFEAGKPVILPGPWLGVALCLVAWMLNPWGPELLGLHLHALDASNPSRDLIEWQATTFSLDPRRFEGRFWLMAISMLPGWLRALRKERDLAVLCALTLVMAMISRRFIPLFALASAPLVAMTIGDAQRFLMTRCRVLSTPSAALAACGVGLVAALWLWQHVRLTPHLLERWTASDRMPHAAARYLNALGPSPRVLNDYGWGGYLMLHAPESRIFIDGRGEAVYDSEIYLANRALRSVASGFAGLLARYPADVALLPPESALAREMTRLPEPWRVIYGDAIAVVLLSPHSSLRDAELPAVNEVLEGNSQLDLAAAQLAERRGELDQAMEQVEAVLVRDPLNLLAHRQLILLHAAAKDPEGIERAVAAGLRVAPRRWLDLLNAEGFAFLMLGDLPRSLAAYRRAIPRGPFRSRDSALRRVAWLEQELR
jgi:tetratricopeptide (TPR) repeat protein